MPDKIYTEKEMIKLNSEYQHIQLIKNWFRELIPYNGKIVNGWINNKIKELNHLQAEIRKELMK